MSTVYHKFCKKTPTLRRVLYKVFSLTTGSVSNIIIAIMTDLTAALEYLNSDYLLNVSIIDPIKRDTAEVLYASNDCVMVRDKLSDVIMLQTENIRLADRLLDTIPQSTTHIVAHNVALAELVENKFGYKKRVPCNQAVYGKNPFVIEGSGLEIRLMREEDEEEASEMYFDSVEEAKEHILLGLVYGGFHNGKIAAMIGRHYQGSMGLLVVKEEFRRRGFGEIMEKFLINSLLEQGLTPYCQIIEGNTASLSLQRKIGLDISENMLYWMIKSGLSSCGNE